MRPLPIEELRDADEIFITSSAGGIMPVTVLDGRIYGNGKPGPITNRIHDLYWAAHKAGPLCTTVDYGATA
jgi:branched-chain amino acid aminotransferase